MNGFSFVPTWPTTSLMIAATAIGILRFKVPPTWLGWSGVVAAVALLVAVLLAFGPGAFVAFVASARPAREATAPATRDALSAAG